MADTKRLMCVFAHPDDESLGAGAMLAKYAAEGVETYLVTATRGEHGWFGDPDAYPGVQELGAMREQELLNAAQVLGLKEVHFLDYEDSLLDQADSQEAVAKIVAHIRRLQPQIIVTFDSFGGYGHPDHIAISQLATTAVVAAADAHYTDADSRYAHRVSKLYYMAFTHQEMIDYERVFGQLVMHIDGVERRATPWPEWAVSALLDTSDYVDTVWEAVACHRTQLPGYEALIAKRDELTLWESLAYYRALSFINNGGREIETDLFAGL